MIALVLVVSVGAMDIGTFCHTTQMCLKGYTYNSTFTVDFNMYDSGTKIPECVTKQDTGCVSHFWLENTGTQGKIWYAYSPKETSETSTQLIYAEYVNSGTQLNVNFGFEPKPDCQLNSEIFQGEKRKFCTEGKTENSEFPLEVRIESAAGSEEIWIKGDVDKVQLQEKMEESRVGHSGEFKVLISVGTHLEQYQDFDIQQLTKDDVMRANVVANLVYEFGNVSYRSHQKKLYNFKNVGTYNFLPKDRSSTLNYFSNHGYELLQVFKTNKNLGFKVLKSWLNLVDSKGWMPNLEPIYRDKNNTNTTIDDHIEHCDLPTYLLAVKYLLNQNNTESLSFFEEVWEPLQLRFKYCYKIHSNYHLPGAYIWDQDYIQAVIKSDQVITKSNQKSNL